MHRKRKPKNSPHASKVEWLRLDELHIDPEAQRDLRKGWVTRLTNEFDPDRVGMVVVNRRADGRWYIIDGQHRVEAMRQMGWGDQRIPCECFVGLTQRQEAALFLHRNDRIAVRTFDKFRVRITSGDPVARGVEAILSHFNLQLGQYRSGENAVSAVNALEKVYRGAGIASQAEGQNALHLTLATIINAWGRESRNFDAQIVAGLGLFYLRYTIRKTDHLVQKLASMPGGVAGVIGQAKTLRDAYGGSLSKAVAGFVARRYNHGLRKSDKLQDWWS